MGRNMRFKIRNKTVDVRLVSAETIKRLHPGAELHGFYHEYVDGKNIIRVDKALPVEKKFEIVLHECLHCADTNLTEKFVSESSECITKVLLEFFDIENRPNKSVDSPNRGV